MINKIQTLIIFLLLSNNIVVSQNNDLAQPPYTFLESKVSKFDSNDNYYKTNSYNE